MTELFQAWSWASMLEVTFGSSLAFLLGLIAFHYQHKRQRDAHNRKEREFAIDAINRTLISVDFNLSMLTNLKNQFLVDLRPEALCLEAVCDRYHQAEGKEERHRILHEMKSCAEEMKYLYKTHIPRPLTRPPEYKELSAIAKDMPTLATFLFSGIDAVEQVNAITIERNRVIAEQAREAAEGINGKRFSHFSSQISSLSGGLCMMADAGLMYFGLAAQQLEYFARAHPNEGVLEFKLSPEISAAIPDSERRLDLTGRIEKFGLN